MDIHETMKAVVVREFGDESKMVVEEVRTPRPGPGQVLVEVKAAGINPVETYIRSGKYGVLPPLPWTPGNDGAGVVAAVGEGVSVPSVGKRVWIAGSLSGTYAQYALCDATSVHALPFSVTYEQGAAINIPYRTAYRALFQKARGRPGQTLLVHGGTGACGLACIQFGVSLGMKVFATAGTASGEELVRQEGALPFNHKKEGYAKQIMEATEGTGVDLIVEMLANVNLGIDLQLLSRGGTVAIVGSRGSVEVTPRDLMAREASVVGVQGIAPGVEGQEACAAINAGLASRTLRPIVGTCYPGLAAASQAHHDVIEHAGGSKGKLVLNPWA